jgi:hypothetical protein
MNSQNAIQNEDRKIILPKIKNINQDLKINSNSVNNLNSFLNKKFTNQTLQKLFESEKLNRRNLNIDSENSPRRKFEIEKENHKIKKIKNSFTNFDKQKNLKILKEIENMIFSFKTKELNLNNNSEIRDSLLNTFKNFVIFKRKKEFSEGVPILKIKKNEFMENLSKCEKVF